MYSNHQYTLPVAALKEEARSSFIRKTYLHLILAIACFVAMEVFLFQSGLAAVIAQFVFGTSWLLILGAFIVLGWLARSFAMSTRSKAAQYSGLIGYTILQALIFVPILFIAQNKAGGGVIENAASATLLGFVGLTFIAFATKADFSWMGKVLMFGGILALALIVSGVLFGFSLGIFFAYAMVALAGASVLYETSNIIHHYPEDAHVAASLSLFASIAMMFWYILQIFMSRD